MQIQYDGGVRQIDAVAAPAFCVIAYVREGTDYKQVLLYAACKYYTYRVSAFRAEAMALHDASYFLHSSFNSP